MVAQGRAAADGRHVRAQTRLIANALGPAPDYMVEHAHAHDVVVAGLVGKKVHAERQKNAGVDIIVAQGYEAGGHTGEIGTMVLIPEVVDAVAPVPVLAAGGIGTGRQIAASLALGAQGVWCGSVWLTTEEAETHPVVKEKFLAATSSDTVRSRASTGKPARSCARRGPTSGKTRPTPIRCRCRCTACSSPRPRAACAARRRPTTAPAKLVNYFVGQVVGQMNKVKPARQVVLDMVEEFIDAAERVAHTLGHLTPTVVFLRRTPRVPDLRKQERGSPVSLGTKPS